MNLIAGFFYGLIVYSFVGVFLLFILIGIFVGMIVFYTYLAFELIISSFRKLT